MEQSTKDDDILEMVVFRSENSKRVAGSPNQLGISIAVYACSRIRA